MICRCLAWTIALHHGKGDDEQRQHAGVSYNKPIDAVAMMPVEQTSHALLTLKLRDVISHESAWRRHLKDSFVWRRAVSHANNCTRFACAKLMNSHEDADTWDAASAHSAYLLGHRVDSGGVTCECAFACTML